MKKRIVSLLLALVMVLTLVPTTVWAAEDHDGQVRVIVENTTYAKADGAAWDGTLVDKWVERLGRVLLAGKGFTAREMKHTFPLIAKEFATIPVTRVPKVKVGVVGEIYVKYSPLGNNDLQKFLESQDCEVNFPGLMGFVQYCAFNMGEDHVLYGGKLAVKIGIDQFLNWLDAFGEKNGIKFTVTISADEDTATEGMKQYI